MFCIVSILWQNIVRVIKRKKFGDNTDDEGAVGQMVFVFVGAGTWGEGGQRFAPKYVIFFYMTLAY